MSTGNVQVLLDYIRTRHPRSARGVEEARSVDPGRFDRVAEQFLGWLVRARGDEGIPAAADAFVRFSTDVNLAQAHYEADGRYKNKTYEDCYNDLYNNKEEMDDYLWGI